MISYLFLQVLVVADHDHPVPTCFEFPAIVASFCALLRLVVHAAVAVDADPVPSPWYKKSVTHHIVQRVLGEVGQPPAGAVQPSRELRSSSDRLSVSSRSQR